MIVAPGFTSAFCWRGAGSDKAEWECADNLLHQLKVIEHHEDFNEGEESDLFWEVLGGKTEYSSQKEAANVIPGFEPRLFNVSNASGFMWVKEVPNFIQEDLINSDVFFLDCYHTVFIWIGRMAEKQEITGAYKRAEQYIANVKDSRNKDNV